MPVVAEQQADELDDYQRVRFQAARRAGLTRVEAARFAAGTVPLATLRQLRKQGCPSATLARIVC